MKQSVENNIKKAFDAWDEQPSDIGFNKEALWQSIHPAPGKKIMVLSWTRAAAAILICILAGGWLNAMYTNQQLKKEKQTLADQLEQSTHTRPTNIPTTEQAPSKPQIIYKTKIKEVDSPHSQTMLAKLARKYQSVENENELLKQQIKQVTSSQMLLNDSIQGLLGNLRNIEHAYALQTQATQAPKDNTLEITIDEEALLALTAYEKAVPQSHKSAPRQFQLTLKNNLEKPEKSAPLFRNDR